jgi:uncharacterized protein
MVTSSREFQIFVKPTGPLCNLGCRYCYYLEKEVLFPVDDKLRMPEKTLEDYIAQHIKASPGDVIRFSWHGGEPTILGLDYFQKIVDLQRKYNPSNKRILNGIQTNGTLLDDEWCRFFAEEGFAVGLSLDGPRDMHDKYRSTKDLKSTFEQVMMGYDLLQRYRVYTDLLCVVSNYNVRFPTRLYRFFKEINAKYITFIPLVEKDDESVVKDFSVSAKSWGKFLCTIFDEWIEEDIGRVKVQIFEEALKTAFNQEHSLCIFRPICGDIPVVEHNGDFYSCDHYVDDKHRLGNILEKPLVELLESPSQLAFGRVKLESLPRYCLECEVRSMCNGECPKNRFVQTPDGEQGLNYLCEGYKRFFNHCKPFVIQVARLWSQSL